MDFPINERGGWIVEPYTIIPAGTVIPAWSEIWEGCKLGPNCQLGGGCKLGEDCELGGGCKLGMYCELERGCELENGPVEQWLTLANVDGSGRQILLIVRPDGVRHIRAGCFFGTQDEFVARANGQGKFKYAAVIPAVFDALKKLQ